MSLFGMSAMAFWLGLLGLAAGLFGLHLLRVRLRRVEVDTLLFFRLAGALQKPRVLPGRPARLLAYLLGLLVLGLAWLTVAAPRSGLGAPSRLVVVEPASLTAGGGDAAAATGLATAMELQQAGLGPRGAIHAAVMPPALLYAAGEAPGLLAARWQVLRQRVAADAGIAGGTAASAAAAAAVAALARPGDELHWVGARLPAAAGNWRHHASPVPAGELLQAAWRSEPEGQHTLCLRLHGEAASYALRAGDTELARATAPAGLHELELGPVALPAGARSLSLHSEAFAGALPLVAPKPAVRVAALALPGEWQQLLAVVVAADPALEWVADASAAAVVVALADDASDPRPRLVLSAGLGDGPRRAVLPEGVPLPLSLRDQRRRAAAALPAVDGALVWVLDAEQGQPLVQAVPHPGAARVQIVDWLLQPSTHADLPVLLSAALRELGGVGQQLLPVPGQPTWQRTLLPQKATAGGQLPVAGAVPAHLQHAVPALGWRSAAAAVPAGTHAPLSDTIGGAGVWAPWLLACLLLLCLIDAILFHRARLP
jgi:hypothetical protein